MYERQESECMRALRSLQGNSDEDRRLQRCDQENAKAGGKDLNHGCNVHPLPPRSRPNQEC